MKTAAFSTSYIPKVKINFGKRDKFHLYHNETGERLITNLTRLNMIFIAGNSILLLLEVLSPCKLKLALFIHIYSLWILAWSVTFNDFIIFIYWDIYDIILFHTTHT